MPTYKGFFLQVSILQRSWWLCISTGRWFLALIIWWAILTLTFRMKDIRGRPQKLLLSFLIFQFLLNCWNYSMITYTYILLLTKYSFIITRSTGNVNDNLVNLSARLGSLPSMLTWPFNINVRVWKLISWFFSNAHTSSLLLVILSLYGGLG